MHDTIRSLLLPWWLLCMHVKCSIFIDLYLTYALCLLVAHLIRFASCILLSSPIFLRIRSNHKHLRRGWLSRCGPQVLCSQGEILVYNASLVCLVSSMAEKLTWLVLCFDSYLCICIIIYRDKNLWHTPINHSRMAMCISVLLIYMDLPWRH